MASERSILPPSSYLSLPMNSVGHGLPAITFDYRTMHVPSFDATIKYEQFQVGDYMIPDMQPSMTPNGIPVGQSFLRRDAQASSGQYKLWDAGYMMSALADSDMSNTRESRSISRNSYHWQQLKAETFSPASHFAAAGSSPSNVSISSPDLVHPIPKHGLSTVASYYASGNVPGTTPLAGQTESISTDRMSENGSYLTEGTNVASDDLTHPCLLSCQSPDSTTITTAPEYYTTTVTEETYNINASSSWSSLNTQLPCDGLANVSQSDNEAPWSNAPVSSDTDQEQGQHNQISAASDEINGLPCLGISTESFVQSSSLLEPYGSTYQSLYSADNSTTHSEHSPNQFPGDDPILLDNFRADHFTGSCFNIPGRVPFQQCHSSCLSPWTIDTRNALLIECKRRGWSYKEIKRIGGFKEAESTLRGRYRTLTKSKEQRVRRPQWHENDIRLLCEAVNIYSEEGRYNPRQSVCRSRRPNLQSRVPWKKVSQYIWSNGGSYQFGNSTCKKKWCEVRCQA